MGNRYAFGVSILVLLACVMPRATAGSVDERQAAWEELATIVGRQVRLVMPDGARIEGRAIALEVDALGVDIRKTTNKTAYPKGRFLVPRSTLRAVDVVQSSTKRWRILCLALGGGIGYLAARGAINSEKSSGAGAGTLGLGTLAVGLPVAGYLIGAAADRRATTYIILP
jgi:hypothetical protein